MAFTHIMKIDGVEACGMTHNTAREAEECAEWIKHDMAAMGYADHVMNQT